MPVKTVTKRQKKELGEIVQADAEFISVVRHAANRQGFRVVKDDSSKAQPAHYSVMIPKGVSKEDVASEPGCEWLTDIDIPFVDKGDYLEAVLADKAKFDDTTFRYKKEGSKGAMAIVGMVKGVSNKSFIMPAPVMEDGSLGNSFKGAFLEEINALSQAVLGMLGQSQLSINDLKDGIRISADAFSSSVSMLLDNMPSDANQETEDDTTDKSDKKIGGQEMNLFETKEEMAGFIKEVMKSELDEFKKTVKKADEAIAPETPELTEEQKAALKKKLEEEALEKKLQEEASTKSDTRIQELSAQVEALTQKLSVKSHAGDEDPDADEEFAKQVQKWEEFPNGVPKEHRKGIFGNIFARVQG